MKNNIMLIKKVSMCVGFVVILFGYIPSVFSAPVFFFGEDSTSSTLPVPNSAAAQASFLSNLIGVGTEDFEGLAVGNAFPIAVNLGGSLATLSGTNNISNTGVAASGIGGRFAISGSQYLNLGSDDALSFTLTFDIAQVAFGFFATDIGDVNGQLTLSFDGAPAIDVPHATPSNNGAALFWGVIDVQNPFTTVQFGNSIGDADAFGFDDFTIGTIQQVKPVSEPAIIALLGLSLCSLGFTRRMRKS